MLRELCVFPKDFRLEDVLEKRKRLAELFQEEEVSLAYLYGSLLEGKGRDADIAVLFKNYSFSSYQHLYQELCCLFHADNVDLLPLNRASFPLKKRIALTGLLIYESSPFEDLKLVQEILTWFEDHRYFSRAAEVELGKRIEGGISMAIRKPDTERVRNYLSRLDEMVGRLVALRKGFASFDDFMSKVDQRELSVHYLRIALECVLDVCRHFVAVKGISLAEVDTTNLIELAGEKGLIPTDFARRIRGMAGMRNAIVHVYWNLDYAAIYEVIDERLSDFDDFAKYTLEYLEREGQEPK